MNDVNTSDFLQKPQADTNFKQRSDTLKTTPQAQNEYGKLKQFCMRLTQINGPMNKVRLWVLFKKNQSM